MSSSIILFGQGAQLPAYLQNKATLALINSDVASSGTSFPVLSIKGKVFTLVKDKMKKVLMRPDDQDEVLQNINLAVVRANKNSRVFYAKAYSEDSDDSGAAKLPDCYSGDGVAPAGDAKSPQAKKCQLCPHAVWGSKAGDSGKGTACSVNTRLAVVDPDNVGEPWLLRVPAGSRANFADACKVADSRGLPYNAVIFKVGFDPLAPSPKLTFKPIGLASDTAYAKISEMYDTDDLKDIVGLLPHAPRAREEDDTPAAGFTADELDAALETKKAVVAAQTKAKALPKPAPAPVVEDITMDDIEDIVAKAEVPVAAPAPVKAKPAPKAAPKVEAPAASNDMSDLLSDLDSLLDSTDD